MGTSRFVNAIVPVVPFKRDEDDVEVFLGPRIVVGRDDAGEEVAVQFGGHRDLDGVTASCVVLVSVGNRDAVTIPIETVDALAAELVRQCALGSVVADPPVVAIDLDHTCRADGFDVDDKQDLATVVSWPLTSLGA